MASGQRRYRELERYVTYALLGDGAILFLYLLCAGFGIVWLKVILAIIGIVGSGLGLGFLYLTGELLRIRSRWMVTGFAAVILCILVSLILNYPSPNPQRGAKNPSSSGSSSTGETSGKSSGGETGTDGTSGATTGSTESTGEANNGTTAPSAPDGTTSAASVAGYFIGDAFAI